MDLQSVDMHFKAPLMPYMSREFHIRVSLESSIGNSCKGFFYQVKKYKK